MSLKITANEVAAEPADRVTTGNSQVDQILHGGFPAHSLNIIMGQPGTGKTIFAEQLLFHNATDERPTLYLTTLSEPFQKVISYLQRFTFFDAAKFGSSVIYDDVGNELVQNGVEALHQKIRVVLRELQPKVIVIDSFKAVHDLIDSTQQARRWIVNLAGELAASDATTFLVGEYTDDHIASYPEFAVADGIIEFARMRLSNRDERFMRVLKLRGSQYQEGLHGLRIGADGLVVYPRLGSARVAENSVSLKRVSSGIPTLDAMFGGGYWSGSSTLVVGSAGAGKTTLALQFIIDGVLRGEPGMFLNFQENPAQLARVIRGLGHDLADLRARGLHTWYFSPVELHIDSIIAGLFQIIQDAGIKRIAVDAVGDLVAAASDDNRLHDYLYSLMQHLAGSGVTSLMTLETPEQGDVTSVTSGMRLSYMSDSIILLTLDAPPSIKRQIRVLKARATRHDLAAHPFAITDLGLQVQ